MPEDKCITLFDKEFTLITNHALVLKRHCHE